MKRLGSLSVEREENASKENPTNNLVSYESANEADKEAENEMSKSGNMLRDSPASKHSVDHSRRSGRSSRASRTQDCNAEKTTGVVFTTDGQQQF